VAQTTDAALGTLLAKRSCDGTVACWAGARGLPIERAKRAGLTMARARPRLVHLTTVDSSLAILLLPQLVAFAEAGYEVVGVSAPGPFVSQLEEAGIRHVPLSNATRSSAPLRDAAALLEFYRLCRKLRPDIVHTHNPKTGVYGRIAAWLARVPVVVNTVHGLYALPEDPLHKRALVYTLERIAATCSDVELLQNEEDVAVLRKLRIDDSRLIVLGNGVDLHRFAPERWPADERDRVRQELGVADDDLAVVGVVGRLVAEKGYRELFSALELLNDLRDRLRVVIVGTADHAKTDALGPQEIEHATQLGVKFLGWRDDVDRLYLGMDMYVLPSHREGFPRAAMEATAMGLPVVATDIRGCRQVVDDGMTGSLVPVKDPLRLAAAMRLLIEDDELRTRQAAAARERAIKHFDDRTLIATTLAVYASLGMPGRPDEG
jgi:glycosyltransferase involved in cell wall biosynthesis